MLLLLLLLLFRSSVTFCDFVIGGIVTVGVGAGDGDGEDEIDDGGDISKVDDAEDEDDNAVDDGDGDCEGDINGDDIKDELFELPVLLLLFIGNNVVGLAIIPFLSFTTVTIAFLLLKGISLSIILGLQVLYIRFDIVNVCGIVLF